MLWNRPDPVFGFLVHDISRLLRKRFDRRARGLGLTKSQWIVLAHLARHEGIHKSWSSSPRLSPAISIGSKTPAGSNADRTPTTGAPGACT